MISKGDQHRSAEEIVEGLLRHEPINLSDLKSRIKGVDKERLAKALADRLLQPDIHPMDCRTLSIVVMQVGVGRELERFVDAVTCTDLPGWVRAQAQGIVILLAPDQVAKVEERMTPEIRRGIIEASLQELILAIEDEPARGENLVAILETISPDVLQPAWEHMELMRVEAGARAALIYRQPLLRESLKSLHPAMLEKVCSEGGTEASILLTELKKSAKDEDQQRLLQGMLLRVRTAGIAPKKSLMQVKGEAYVSSCDGQGAFVLFGRCRRRGSTSTTTADLCIRAAGEVRDGFVVKRHSESDFREMMEQVSPNRSLDFVRISLPDAAALVEEAMARTRSMGCSLAPEVTAAVQHFEDARELAVLLNVPEERSDEDISLESFRDLLEEDIYEYWFLDEGDLRAARIRGPSTTKEKVSWLVDSAGRLAKTAYRDRVLAMARHMALWHSWNGEPEMAELFAAALSQMESDFANCSLIHAILEKSIIYRNPSLPVASEYRELGNKRQRQAIKELLFHGVNSPTGSDLALLDFTELVVEVFDKIVFVLPGERRPTNDSFFCIGYAIAKACLHEPWDEAKEMESAIVKAITSASNLTIQEAGLLAPTIRQSLVRFFSDCCEHCPVGCLDRLDSKQTKAFFSPSHPAEEAYVYIDMEGLLAQNPPKPKKHGKPRTRDQREMQP